MNLASSPSTTPQPPALCLAATVRWKRRASPLRPDVGTSSCCDSFSHTLTTCRADLPIGRRKEERDDTPATRLPGERRPKRCRSGTARQSVRQQERVLRQKQGHFFNLRVSWRTKSPQKHTQKYNQLAIESFHDLKPSPRRAFRSHSCSFPDTNACSFQLPPALFCCFKQTVYC